ncbi:hypothetical protein V1514DRAFT_326382 [Lipomyces japonicus]|uniref:uncharacterized protein n=1 Tax=Lipomyces japonicus TaxID=56871 RepID=UPI0034CFFFBB
MLDLASLPDLSSLPTPPSSSISSSSSSPSTELCGLPASFITGCAMHIGSQLFDHCRITTLEVDQILTTAYGHRHRYLSLNAMAAASCLIAGLSDKVFMDLNSTSMPHHVGRLVLISSLMLAHKLTTDETLPLSFWAGLTTPHMTKSAIQITEMTMLFDVEFNFSHYCNSQALHATITTFQSCQKLVQFFLPPPPPELPAINSNPCHDSLNVH